MTTSETLPQPQQLAVLASETTEAVTAFASIYMERGLTKPQVSFLILNEKKKITTDVLTRKQLEAQKILLDLKKQVDEWNIYQAALSDGNPTNITPVKHPSITEVEGTLKRYRDVFSEMKDSIRMQFTNFIKDRIIVPLMEFEKQVDPSTNEVYKTLENELIKFKRKQIEESDRQVRKQQEINQYTAHINKENSARVLEYTQAWMKELSNVYSDYLRGHVENPDTSVLKSVISEFKLRPAIKYKRTLVTDTEAVAIIAKIEMPKIELLLAEALLAVDNRFSLYSNDLAQVKLRPAETLQSLANTNNAAVCRIQAEAAVVGAVHDLVASSSELPIIALEGKSLKKTVSIVIENTQEWAVAVLSEFLANPKCFEYLKVKEWSNLKLSQMADALGKLAGETGKKSTKFTYMETEK